MNSTFYFERFARWGIKGGASILDQGVYSGANFISMILFARWLEPREYGAYSVAFASSLFLSGIYTGLVLEPISILGASRSELEKQDYFNKQIFIHILVALPLSGIMYVCHLLIRDDLLKSAFQIASIALPFMLLPGLGRRIYYSDHKPEGAFVCSLIYAVSVFVGLFLISRSTEISASSFFTIMAIGGLFSYLPILSQIVRFKDTVVRSNTTAFEIAILHWNLGKWIVLGAIFLLLSELMPVLFITTLSGLEGAGIFKALQNLIQPMVQVETALSLAGLPALAREYTRKNISGFRQKGFVLTALMTGLAIVYALILLRCHNELEGLLYHGQYAAYAGLIPFFGFVPILIGLFSGFSLSVRVLQLRQVYVLSGIIPFLLGAPVCYLLTQNNGVEGVVTGVVFIHLVILVVNLSLYCWLIPNEL